MLAAHNISLPPFCSIQDFSRARVEVDFLADSLFDFLVKVLRDLRARKQSAPEEVLNELVSKEDELASLRIKLQRYSVRRLPSARLVCPPSESTCRSVSLLRQTSGYIRLVRQSYRVFVRTLYKLRKRGSVTSAYYSAQKRDGRYLRRWTIEKLRRIKWDTSLCR